MFAQTKAGHLVHILSTALAGQVVTQELTPPNPHVVELYGHLLIQVLVAVVTIWATVRKALQKPEAVVKLPVAAVPVVVPESALSDAEGTPVADAQKPLP
ncbi:hypothetical protein [Hymenobacter profundi]|uniref:Uncharacterized protein n=1 Tax=Hymenobacter profundi TaxID=1982110 RepID=A0ABS6WUN5_9BACT|nr:hypothetical protein [Hymenobacter profundi]MBW3127284.1 hypothetical protein [Hymenobacter profundi]